MVHLSPTGETGKGASQSHFQIHPAGCFLWSSGPEILLFMGFKEQWSCIDQNKLSTARDYNATASAVFGLLQDMLLFAGEQLRNQQPRDD